MTGHGVAGMAQGASPSARDEVLARIRTALADVPADDEVAVPRDYRHNHADGDIVQLFDERVADYRATVVRVAADGVAAEIARVLGDRTAIVGPGFPADWLPPRDWVRDEPPLSTEALDHVDAAVTTAAVGIALTGTIVLDGGDGQGRRALTLVPDMHICVIRADQIAADVPGALSRLDPTRPLTLFSGPSATSDIELQRVEGVHGPRTLHVITVTEGVDEVALHTRVRANRTDDDEAGLLLV
jgi:L-lactate dehydrogenase complex protein LldG